MSEHPNFLIVCDHGIRGGRLDPVVRFQWGQQGWEIPLQFTAAALTLLTGDQLTLNHLGEEATRLHYEIPCQTTHCTRREYRSPEDKLQTLFTEIAGNEKFRTLFAASATAAEITVTLDALHYARDTLRKHFGLRV
jgi:hypothetical protein